MAKPIKIDLRDNSLHNLQGGVWNQRQVRKLDLNRLDFEKLRVLSEELNDKLHDKSFMGKNLHLFGENYEHNTDDDLIKVLGWNDSNYMIETGNLVGYVSTSNFKITISSRFGENFLKYLLCYTEGLLEIPETGTIGDNGLYDWIMLFLWKSALQRAYRLGIPKQYIPQHEKLFTIKGNVDVLNYAVNNGKDGKTLCHFYQYDYNNPVTQLISYTFSKIENKSLIKDCIKLKNTFDTCVEGKKSSLSAYLNTSPISNPYYSEYNKVISLSKNILRKRFGDITDSSNISSAFLFDMSMLFEYFIRKVLLAGGLTLFQKNDDSMTISRGLGENNDRHLYPDIIIDKGNNQIEVYDVKYKHFDNKNGVKREDLFQLHTYVSYLSNQYDVKKCGIIYPQLKKENCLDLINNSICLNKKSIPFSILFFNIPENNNASYSELENIFVNHFKN